MRPNNNLSKNMRTAQRPKDTLYRLIDAYYSESADDKKKERVKAVIQHIPREELIELSKYTKRFSESPMIEAFNGENPYFDHSKLSLDGLVKVFVESGINCQELATYIIDTVPNKEVVADVIGRLYRLSGTLDEEGLYERIRASEDVENPDELIATIQDAIHPLRSASKVGGSAVIIKYTI